MKRMAHWHLVGTQLRIHRQHIGHRFARSPRGALSEHPTRSAARDLLCEPRSHRLARVAPLLICFIATNAKDRGHTSTSILYYTRSKKCKSILLYK